MRLSNVYIGHHYTWEDDLYIVTCLLIPKSMTDCSACSGPVHCVHYEDQIRLAIKRSFINHPPAAALWLKRHTSGTNHHNDYNTTSQIWYTNIPNHHPYLTSRRYHHSDIYVSTGLCIMYDMLMLPRTLFVSGITAMNLAENHGIYHILLHSLVTSIHMCPVNYTIHAEHPCILLGAIFDRHTVSSHCTHAEVACVGTRLGLGTKLRLVAYWFLQQNYMEAGCLAAWHYFLYLYKQ